MNLPELQTAVDTWIREHGGYWDEFHLLARLVEELGEISSDLQRGRGLRPRSTPTDLDAEVGDLLFTLVAFANVLGIDLDACIQRTIQKYSDRDGAAWKANNREQ